MNTAKHWLTRPRTIAYLRRVGYVILALTLVAELSYVAHPYFTIDGWFSFHAVFGFLACVAMVFFAKLLGVFARRNEDFYEAGE